MPIATIIRKKRDGEELSDEEIFRIVEGASDGSIPDYQLSAFLMAVYFQGMSMRETARLTAAMARSGGRLDLSALEAPAVDKHSTGGVGDKVSLVLAPIVAACGAPIPMISGRGLGHTGGTVDKLESIPGFRTALSHEEIERQVAEIGIAMASQSDELVPADKRLYALRDVTGTIESLPLITASILSKKIAEGIGALVMDVKCGRGAFMPSLERARALAESIRLVAEENGLRCSTLITRMDSPLGRRIGNWLEVCEAVRVLRGEEEPPLLMEVVHSLSGAALVAAGRASSVEEGEAMSRRAIEDGSAYERFLELVRRQGGDVVAVEHAVEPPPSEVILSDRAGYVTGIDSLRLGLLAIELGAGRHALGDEIAPQAGIVIYKHRGESVARGTPICGVVELRSGIKVDPETVRSCFTISDHPPTNESMVIERS